LIRRLGWTAVLAVFVLTAAADPRPGQAAVSSSGRASATYPDLTGDSGTAPDITSVAVSSDPENQITFRVNVVKLALPSDGHVVIAIDSDQNAATGYEGVDYMFLADLSSNDFLVARWNGSDFAFRKMSTAAASTDATGVSFSINARELGRTTGFSFFARTVVGTNVAAGHYDDAPDVGEWTYELGGASALTLTVEDPIASKARAGKRLVVFITVVRSDGKQAEVTYGEITCVATIAGRSLPAIAIPTYGPAAGCSWRLPKRSNGRTLHAAIAVTVDGATVTQTFSTQIK
jgi:hypothetical protein